MDFMVSVLIVGIFYGVAVIALWELGKWLASLVF
jgi:hypothetical protein